MSWIERISFLRERISIPKKEPNTRNWWKKWKFEIGQRFVLQVDDKALSRFQVIINRDEFVIGDKFVFMGMARFEYRFILESHYKRVVSGQLDEVQQSDFEIIVREDQLKKFEPSELVKVKQRRRQ